MKIFDAPVRVELKAMYRPSGDQFGLSLFPELGVILRSPDPSIPMVKIWKRPSALPQKAIRSPLGDQEELVL